MIPYANVKDLTIKITHVHSSTQKCGFHKPVIAILITIMIFK